MESSFLPKYEQKNLMDSALQVYIDYSYNSIKRICSIKRPGLDYFKKSLLNDQYDL